MAHSGVIVRPDFLVIGAPKAGTTWVHEFLAQNGAFFVPRAKDTFFFDRHFDRGEGWYAQHFADAAEGQLVGEVCHDYMYSQLALKRIAGHYAKPPHAILVLREPVSRSISHLRYSHQLGNVASLDASALVANPNIVELSRYDLHLGNVRRHLGDDVSVLFFEDLRRSPESFARSLAHACGAGPDMDFALPGRSNAGGVARSRTAAKLAIRAARGLDRLGARSVVGALKSSPIRTALFDTTTTPEIADDVIELLDGQLAESRTRSIELLEDYGLTTDDQIPSEWRR